MIINTFFGSVFDRVINLHNCGLITASVTIIRGRKASDDTSIVLPLVTFHHQLVRAGNEMQPVDVGKLLGDVLAKGVASSPWRDSPATSVKGDMKMG